MTAALTLEDYQALAGRKAGVSGWFVMDQKRIDAFAEDTEDRQYIHIDPTAAAASPFGGTIAHGFLILSMLSAMSYSAIPPIEGAVTSVNYGLNGVRFIRPVRAGQRIRGCFTLSAINERSPGQWQSTFSVAVEIEGEAKPALVAEWLVLNILA